MTGMVLTWIVVGAIAGWLAGLAVRGSGLGVIGNLLVGIIGAVIGGLVLNALGGPGVTGLNPWSIGVAFFGAVVLLLLLRLLSSGTNNA